MFQKFNLLCLIFGLWCSLAAANRLDQYGVYGTLDDGSISSTTTARYNAALRCLGVNPQQSVDLEQVRRERFLERTYAHWN